MCARMCVCVYVKGKKRRRSEDIIIRLSRMIDVGDLRIYLFLSLKDFSWDLNLNLLRDEGKKRSVGNPETERYREREREREIEREKKI